MKRRICAAWIPAMTGLILATACGHPAAAPTPTPSPATATNAPSRSGSQTPPPAPTSMAHTHAQHPSTAAADSARKSAQNNMNQLMNVIQALH
ncbi:hypothetical protein [Alicyclobacillus contaminans]|uniref:hypothetical protein n=1 Tax=Alicyclobacillus contaminans TaxID=392016 RepID=UPI0012EB5EB5|nr:hypothetical protein [Alicyclobacillus contaminans]